MGKSGKPELLAPAGGWEQLHYAIHFGADAVYLASDRFGMRRHADNFAIEELPAVVAYAHERGVAVHITCNIIMHDTDMDELPAYLEAFGAAGIDALIVQDLGAFALARQLIPHIDLHVSTQASVSNSAAALAWYELGAKRVVCARELTLAQIARMRRELPDKLELEAFVHGSMCMSYSGRCLISDYLTGRSAVQGDCTQSCRWNYVLEEEKRPGEYYPIEEDGHGSYIMNAQDLCMIEHLDELEAVGIDSFKIEGRNKKAFYVATVVNAYRQVLDGADPAQMRRELDCTSHRPFSSGFYFGPAHQAATEPGYRQSYEWVAEVVSCEPHAKESNYVALLRCRNHFERTSQLEVMSPGRPSRAFTLETLEHFPYPDFATCTATAVEVANRTKEIYRITTACELHPGDIIRERRIPL